MPSDGTSSGGSGGSGDNSSDDESDSDEENELEDDSDASDESEDVEVDARRRYKRLRACSSTRTYNEAGTSTDEVVNSAQILALNLCVSILAAVIV